MEELFDDPDSAVAMTEEFYPEQEALAEVYDYSLMPETELLIAAFPEEEYDLSLVPAETRPPEMIIEPDPSLIIPSISAVPESQSLDYIDPSLFIDPIDDTPIPVQPQIQVIAEAPVIIPAEPILPVIQYIDQSFSAPMIVDLEKGKYYLQIAAYSKAESVQMEISRIDSNLPKAIQNAGSADKPIYRVLIGPVNLGESGALLQRFKTTHKDAFVRLGN